MRRSVLPLFCAVVLAGCATYKELTPEPPLQPQERGYIELKKDDEDFALDQDDQYFIAFPGPTGNQDFLVLVSGKMRLLDTYLTSTFNDGEPPIQKIPLDPLSNDTTLVWAVDASVLKYFWVLDTVRTDVELTMRYRYVPRWRYTFERKYVLSRQLLAGNLADRSIYNSITPAFHFEGFNFSQEGVNLELKNRKLTSLREELIALGRLFPPDIASARDTAYEKYVALKRDVEEELAFQSNYRTVLDVFEKEIQTRGKTEAFLAAAPEFGEFLGQKSRFPKPILDKGCATFQDRLPEAVPFYDRQIRSKADADPLTLRPPVEPVAKLYSACGVALPAEFTAMTSFIGEFNRGAAGLAAASASLRTLSTLPSNKGLWTSDSLYAARIAAANGVTAALPVVALDQFDQYKGLPAVQVMSTQLASANREAAAYQRLYQGARTFASNFAAGSWGTAEAVLTDLHLSPAGTEFPAVRTQKQTIVQHFEDALQARILQLTQQRAQEFVGRNITTLDNVSTLYANPAFTPVYTQTFSAGGPNELARKKKVIQDYLERVKYQQFPDTAIKSIYRDLSANLNDRGVQKARAIVEHGKYYRGEDKAVRAMVDECDVTVPKWITRPKEYRRILAIPITSNPQGTNDYLFRVRLAIPSEAQFPVFDVNIKLPQEIARNARTEQWYQSITINNTPIKNEGRFRITAPTADNNYESLITPVQMDKAGQNILEVKFSYPAYKIFEISAMAQVPIIRKN